MGLTFSNIIILQTQQLHPMKDSPDSEEPPRSTLQVCLNVGNKTRTYPLLYVLLVPYGLDE